MSIKHAKTVFAEDGTDPNAVHPSDWNAEHVLDGLLALWGDLTPAPNTFPVVKVDGSGALAPISAPALAMLSKATALAMLQAIGGVGPDSPSFTGTPTAPTAPLGTNTQQIATMAALQAALANLVSSAPATLDTLQELANALGNDPNYATTVTTALSNRLRVDAAQGLTAAQKAQAIANLALAAVAVSGAYSDLTGRPTLGTAAALDAGTTANKVVQLDASGKLPAVDGSQLLNVSGYVSYLAAQALTDAQRLQVLANLGVPKECGRLRYSSATALTYLPFKGDLLKVNGSVYRIPASGIAGLSNSGVYVNGVAGQALAGSTLYYVYAFVNNGVLTAEFSTTGHATSATSGNVGTEIKNGDDTRSLIGMVYTNASQQFSDAFTATWFNRRTRALSGALLSGVSSPGSYFQEIAAATGPASPGARVYFLVWAEENTVQFSAMLNYSSATTTNMGCQMAYGQAGGAVNATGPSTVQYSNTANNQCVSAVASAAFTEGLAFATVLGGNNSGSATISGQVTVTGIRG
ncbi:hypothetical protein [Bradyrhizobium sp. BTAi1]|uniref:hypothetical protein n=1 Tax=Bradyrhizobium sp. (strain BTAi1 / ATCC BAA-1182) TaxID=288000 RepID=UPI00005DFB9C|nr:hypothetical protein [Bradyrhizobium sp. BTAi1]ABQ38483.1 hypothetical protein BBta_6579 [Bradyrhizobium sp. BTAi1]